MSDATPPVPSADGEPEQLSLPTEPVAPQGPERVVRGLLVSLIVIPLGIAVFTLVWNLGFISALVGFAVAFGAFFLYKVGSGGRISLRGALVITLVTLVTLLLAYPFASIVSPFANHLAATQGYAWFGLVIDPTFWVYAINDRMPFLGGDFLLNGGLTLLFGGIGCFSLLRGVFQSAVPGPQPSA